MKMRYLCVHTMIGLLTLMMMVSPSSAGSMGSDDGQSEKMRNKGMDIERIHQKLGLNEEQQERLTEQRARHREQKSAIYEELRRQRESLDDALRQTDLDVDGIKSIHNRLKETLLKLEDLRLEGILEVRHILTPEQFSEFTGMMEKRHKKFKDGGKWKRDGSGNTKEK